MGSSACKPCSPTADKLAAFFPPLAREGREGAGGFVGHEEPALAELLQDPIFCRLMASDGVHHDHLLTLIEGTRAKLAEYARS